MNVPVQFANETPMQRALRQAQAIDMIVAQLPALTKRTEALLDALPADINWDVRMRVLGILKELDTLRADVAITLHDPLRPSHSS